MYATIINFGLMSLLVFSAAIFGIAHFFYSLSAFLMAFFNSQRAKLKFKDIDGPSNFIELQQGNIHYIKSEGYKSRNVLILLPGFGFYSWIFKEFFKKQYVSEETIYALDFYGTGYSSPTMSYDMTSMVHQLHEFIKTLKIEHPVSLCALGSGAQVALKFAADYPQKVSKLILISPGSVPTFDVSTIPFKIGLWMSRTFLGPFVIQMLFHVCINLDILFEFLLVKIATIPSSFMVGHKKQLTTFMCEVKEICHHINFQIAKTPDYKRHVQSMMVSFPFFGNAPKLHHFDQKNILILWGSHDPLNPSSQMKQYKSYYPNSQAFKLKGHHAIMQNRQDVVDIVKRFIREK